MTMNAPPSAQSPCELTLKVGVIGHYPGGLPRQSPLLDREAEATLVENHFLDPWEFSNHLNHVRSPCVGVIRVLESNPAPAGEQPSCRRRDAQGPLAPWLSGPQE
eukprot:6237233-Pyramimonas_sp.AAC.1